MNFVFLLCVCFAFFTKIKTTSCGPFVAGFHGKSTPGEAHVEETQVRTPAASYFSNPKY